MHVDARGMEEARSTCHELLHLLETRQWDDARQLLSDEFEGYWPQSGERLVGPDQFIALNQAYPGERKFQVRNSMCQYDNWDLEFSVVTDVSVETNMLGGEMHKSLVVSFFELDGDGLIKSVTEYCAASCEVPAWRKPFVDVG